MDGICDFNGECGSFSSDTDSRSAWKDGGTLVLSPSNSQGSSKMYIFGCPLKLQNHDLMKEISDEIDITGYDDHSETDFYSTFNNITGVLQSIENCSSDSFGSSGSSSGIDIVAEFTKSSGHISPGDISTMIYG